MKFLLDHPVIFLLALLIALGSATRLGAALRTRHGPLEEARRSDFDIVLGATLTLLSLIVGFSFSMAASRYDLRKNYEEAEANAIGTAYVRADLLPAPDAARVHELLREYTKLRIRFYTITNYSLDTNELLSELNRATTRAQAQLWAAVVTPVSANQTAPMALVAAAMNDALNSQGYSQAASWNRIPPGAWVLLCTIGMVATVMIGFRFDTGSRQRMLMLILPTLVAISLFLISDIDCPRGGIIRVLPQNLMALQPTLG
jgi:hypothetical protein